MTNEKAKNKKQSLKLLLVHLKTDETKGKKGNSLPFQ